MPQAIAHRGYKAAFPENTMGAFKGAVEIGAQAVETDVHLTKDGVIVLSHDETLKRCFNHEGKIIEHDWEFISTLRTTKEPHQAMPRLLDLLEYLALPGNEEIWCLLDIKLDNEADYIMQRLGETISSVTPSSQRAWCDRIVLGCWAAKYVPLCHKHLPGFPVSHIGFSLFYANQFFRVQNVSFNMLQEVLLGPFGSRFLSKAKAENRTVLVWTVNNELLMRWCIKRGLDGVITDNPKKFLDVRDKWNEGDAVGFMSLKLLWEVIRLNFMTIMFGFAFWRKFRFDWNKAKL